MRRLAWKFWKLFDLRDSQRSLSRKPRRRARRRLEFEALEDRSVPSASGPGVLTGVVFVDANGNGAFDANEIALSGAPIILTGTSSQGAAVDMTVTSDSNGEFAFRSVQPGTYNLSAGPRTGYLGGGASFADLSSSNAGDVVNGLPLSSGGAVHQNLDYRGLDPNFITLGLFLSSTTQDSFPSETAGATFNQAPFVKAPFNPITVGKNSAATQLDLAGFFSDPDITNSMIRFNTSGGPINMQLFDTTAPQTVANFFDYVTSGAYDNSIFHRLATSPSVLQGGGFTFNSANSTINTITALPAVPGEFGASNTPGTIAMALSGMPADVNSGTDQFYFNVGNNAASLDPQRFTVFGQVVSSSDQAVINALSGTTVKNESNFNSAFGTIPLNNYPNDNDPNFPTNTTASNYVLVQSIDVVSRNEALSYAVIGNTNPGLVTTTLVDEHLTLQYAAGATGSAVITVQTTDQFGASVNASISVNVVDQAPTATVGLAPAAPATNAVLTATATASDPNGDPVNLTYNWLVNGNTVKTTANTSSLTDTLNLSTVTVNPGDQVRVNVTPSDGTLNGNVATASVTVNSPPVVGSVVLSPTNPTATSMLMATATTSDPNSDPVTLTYVWTVNGGSPVRTTSNTSSLTDTLDLSTLTLNSGDQISVQVTPNDGKVNGTPVTQSVTF